MATYLQEGTILLERPAYIRGCGSVVGKEEAKGPLGKYFDITAEDTCWGEKTFELAERKMFEKACRHAVQQSRLQLKRLRKAAISLSSSVSAAPISVHAPSLNF